jgi:phosphate transport system substrate-binding protein
MLRVTVSTSGRTIFDSLLDTMATRAGLTGQLAIRYAEPQPALRDFCSEAAGIGPDIVLATDRMQVALVAECTRNGIDVAVVELGRSALIFAARVGSELSGLTSRQVYLAVARDVPFKTEFTRNTAVRWADVDRALPAQDIRFQLPMRGEGSRATFDALVLQGGCRNEPAVRQVFDAQLRTARCVATRTDRVRELPGAQSVKALLEAPVGTVGVLSQREFSQAGGQLVGLAMDGVPPSADAIAQESYEFSTSYWLYARRGARGVARLLAEALSDAVIGPLGPLPALELVPLPSDEREAQRAALATGEAYSAGSVMGWLSATIQDAWHMFAGARQPMPAGMTNAMDFTSLMDIAGYQITGVQSSIGIIPDAVMMFGIARETSDADHLYLERILYHDSLARPGAIAATQRRIIRSIVGARDVGGFEVSKVEVDFLPLPKVSLTVTPKGVAPGTHPLDSGPSESE